MQLFDFHHHHRERRYGIYNPSLQEFPPTHFYSRGIHPKDITEEWDLFFQKIKEESLAKNCLALGECGLDGLVSIPMLIQKEVFSAHVVWANEIKKPMIIHCVRSFAELLPFRRQCKVPMVVHGFSKKEPVAEMLIQHGFHLSFGKAVLHSVSLQKIIKDMPAKLFFLETDDSTTKIEEIYKQVAEIRKISIEELHYQMLENLEKIIRI